VGGYCNDLLEFGGQRTICERGFSEALERRLGFGGEHAAALDDLWGRVGIDWLLASNLLLLAKRRALRLVLLLDLDRA
jgi:hypothetical protein